MWTTENRPRYNRDKLRYPSDLTDEEWALIEPLRWAIRAEVNGKRTYLAATAAGTPKLGSPAKYRGAARTAPPRGSLVHPAGASSRRHHSIHRQHAICLSASGSVTVLGLPSTSGSFRGCAHSIHPS